MAERRFVSRAGDKLDHALEEFGIGVKGLACADFGCNVGGFTDCLLTRGASSVVAVETGYGVLDWTLRNDPRVEVRERTNALHAQPPETPVDLVVIDLAWTPQKLALPAARNWLAMNGEILTLVKPHYELPEDMKGLLDRGFLPQEHAPEVLDRTLRAISEMGFDVLGSTQSPLVGGKTSRKRGVPGNIEYLAHLKPTKKA